MHCDNPPLCALVLDFREQLSRRQRRLLVPKFDLAIIGSGPGGYVAAIRAAQWGLKTLVIEKDPFLGGTCLHIGCIPTKVLLHHADVYETCKKAGEFGVEVSGVQLNWPAILARKDRIVNKHAKGIEFLFRKNKVETMRGWGRWAGPGKVSVENEGKVAEIEATNIMLAAGSEARSLPGVNFDGKVVLDNRAVLALPAVPKTLVVVGAGAVGVEFTSLFHSFGSEVTLLEALPRLVPLEDQDISAELEKSFRRRGVQIFTKAAVESVTPADAGATVVFRDQAGAQQTVAAERAGRRGPRSADRRPGPGILPRENRARLPARRSLSGDGRARPVCHRRHCGRDAATGACRVHGRHHRRGKDGGQISAHARTFAHSQCHLLRTANRFHRPYGKAGREAGACSTNRQVSIGQQPQLPPLEEPRAVKVVAEEKHGEVLGVHAIGPLASEIIAEPVAALQLEATLDDMLFTVHAHPTLWEAMGDAFASVRGLAINA